MVNEVECIGTPLEELVEVAVGIGTERDGLNAEKDSSNILDIYFFFHFAFFLFKKSLKLNDIVGFRGFVEHWRSARLTGSWLRDFVPHSLQCSDFLAFIYLCS